MAQSSISWKYASPKWLFIHRYCCLVLILSDLLLQGRSIALCLHDYTAIILNVSMGFTYYWMFCSTVWQVFCSLIFQVFYKWHINWTHSVTDKTALCKSLQLWIAATPQTFTRFFETLLVEGCVMQLRTSRKKNNSWKRLGGNVPILSFQYLLSWRYWTS